eukprot:470100-Lingulodinium_polyedra.AAC.1
MQRNATHGCHANAHAYAHAPSNARAHANAHANARANACKACVACNAVQIQRHARAHADANPTQPILVQGA